MKRTAISSKMKLSDRQEKNAFFLFFLILCLDTITAFNFFSIPVPWFSYLFTIILLIIFKYEYRIKLKIPNISLILSGYFLLSLYINFGYLIFGFEFKMPPLATTPYYLYIFIRFFVILGYLACLVCTYNLCVRYGSCKIFSIIEIVLLIVSIVGVYIYLAQIFNLWEPPRNRTGTGGQNFLIEKLKFQYAFHRLLGFFREPSHFAEWTVGPLLMVISVSMEKTDILRNIIIISCIFCLFLTGSLLGFIGFLTGILVIVVLNKIHLSAKTLKTVFFILVGGVLALKIFNIDFYSTVIQRFSSLVYGGITETNRSYIWNYLFNNTPPFFGYGLGNSNIILSKYLGSPLTSSHISLAVNSWFSVGCLGIIIIFLFLITPFFYKKTLIIGKLDPIYRGCLAALASWIVFYLGHSEELALIHAVILGIFLSRRNEILIKIKPTY